MVSNGNTEHCAGIRSGSDGLPHRLDYGVSGAQAGVCVALRLMGGTVLVCGVSHH